MGKKIVIDPKSRLYLGIGGSTHDFSACLLKDGKIVSAIESERISRVKHSLDMFSPINSSIKYLLPQRTKINEISSSDILNIYNWYDYKDQIKFYNHHLCHAASSFFTSPFKEAAVFVCDGLGSYNHTSKGYEYETYSYYSAKNRHINLIKKNVGFVNEQLDETHVHSIDVPNSLGLFYNTITKLIGFGFLQDGKTMGLSAYGNSNKYYKQIIEYFSFKPSGIINISFGEKEAKLFYEQNNRYKSSKTRLEFHANIAASSQRILEECYFYCLNYLYKVAPNDNLCISGGVALNSVANGKITQNTPFKNIHIFPACGDAGIAIGSAYLSYYKANRRRVLVKNQSPFLGKNYSKSAILSALRAKRVKHVETTNVYTKTSKLLTNGKIVAWFQGRSEIGPRALGHRSILVDPRKRWMKDYLNKKVKKRAPFRPFAPAILEEYVSEFFEKSRRSPYMQEVFTIKEPMQKFIPAVVHVDGTGRIQTVGPDNEKFYRLIKSFYKNTGVPVVLNTSFNVNSMPIVETPEDAIECFLQTKIDALVIGNFICTKTNDNRKTNK